MKVFKIEDKDICVIFRNDNRGIEISSILNYLAGQSIAFDWVKFGLVLGNINPKFIYTDTVNSEILHIGEQKLQQKIILDSESLEVDIIYEIFDCCLTYYMILKNKGENDVFVRDIVLFYSHLHTHADYIDSFPEQTELINLISDNLSLQHTEAHPIFIDKHIFMGIDWPVAYNEIIDNKIICCQFCGYKLSPMDSLRSKSMTIGVSESGKTSQAFLRHLDSLRGRNNEKVSLYFDWLTHASEGPKEHEIQKQLSMLRMLQNEFDVNFDIYAVDDGAVETRWGLTFEKYRPQHDRLYPSGLKKSTQQAQDMGMSFGIWIGPDGFGESELSARKRIHEVVNMIEEWNIRLIKMDICVSVPLGKDRYRNEWYVEKLQELSLKCREVNPKVIILNHRISSSPYILMILDSTLWLGAESYPDVFLFNNDKPRLFTRYAAYGRGNPSYYGEYSRLLEDHGICFNGDYRGWREEFVLHAFGRSLMISPEVYGTIFLLPDPEYQLLGMLMKLAKEKQHLMIDTRYIEGDFFHSNKNGALICLINDSWDCCEKTVTINEKLGLVRQGQLYIVSMLYPEKDLSSINWIVLWEQEIEVMMHPFAVAVIEISPVSDEFNGKFDRLSGPITTYTDDEINMPIVYLGSFEAEEALLPDDIRNSEKIRFILSNDPTEAQVMHRLQPSFYKEVNECREFFYNKLRSECYGISKNAWDDDPETSWSDEPFWKEYDNVWRIDLGNWYKVDRIEVELAELPSCVDMVNKITKNTNDNVIFEISEDAFKWYSSKAVLFYRRQGIPREYISKLIVDFPKQVDFVRYVRMHIAGVSIKDIRAKKISEFCIEEVPRDGWHGNNLFTLREPKILFRLSTRLERSMKGKYLALVIELPEHIQVPLKQEVAVAWVENTKGDMWPVTNSSPAFPFHGWECNNNTSGNSWTFWIMIRDYMIDEDVTIKLAWFGTMLGMGDHNECKPTVNGYAVFSLYDDESLNQYI